MPGIKLIDDPRSPDLGLMIDGDPSQGHPWNIMLKPEHAFNLGNALAMAALRRLGIHNQTPAQTVAGRSLFENMPPMTMPNPQQQQPQPQQQQRPLQPPQQRLTPGMTGPTSNVDAQAGQNQGGTLFSQQPKPPATGAAPEGLIGDQFP